LSLADLKQKWAQLRDAQPQGAATDADADPLTWLERLPREAAMLACAGGAVLLLMLLASFHPDDPGWMSSGTDGDVRNLAGPAGA